MHVEDTFDVHCSLAAMVADALAVFCGILLATWIRFDSGWLAVVLGRPPHLYAVYAKGAALATLMFLLVYRGLDLYVRPQFGSFGDRIPRLVRATGIGVVLATVAAFMVKNIFSFSSAVILLSLVTVSVIVTIERFLLFRLEIALARRAPSASRLLIVGTGPTAEHVMNSIGREPRFRSKVIGFVRTDPGETAPGIAADSVKGGIDDLAGVLERERPVDQMILTDSSLDHDRLVKMILLCEQNLVAFRLVPDIFRILTGGVEFQTIDDIPLLSVSRWPLDLFWNRFLKRIEDIACSLAGLVIAAPVVAALAVAVKRDSPGPVFYRQERCGRGGRTFTLYKLRTMREGAETRSGPGWTTPDDPRRTKTGAFLRRYGLDELPQLWNVLTGDMSLVGPRPERPHFVEQFKEDIAGYMWRHVSKPGLTGWAQVNGLRGDSSIRERIKYDLYYLENWSLSFDFKIILKTFVARTNAY